jgi:hypothetical protein
MNERIRELAIQSGLNAPYGSDHESLRDFDYKKFAELIVRECAGLAGCNNHVSGFALGDLICEHFGVKE